MKAAKKSNNLFISVKIVVFDIINAVSLRFFTITTPESNWLHYAEQKSDRKLYLHFKKPKFNKV